ncbi:COG1470 family protein [Thermus caldifontis]|uniref:COG1470 family protein n=1 Tax=Thermus caldifontis TaxID=1930763 RepID=UPI000DF4773D|nr:hypothetical protein [Thermus caldifontis]
MRTLLTLSLLANLAFAQGVFLTLSPARMELSAWPGEAFSFGVTLKNEGPREEAIAVRLAPFRLGEDGSLEEVPLSGGLCPELRVIPSAFLLPPGGALEVRVEGRAPMGEGTLACLVVFGAGVRPLERGGVRLQVRPEIGLALYVTLRGKEKPALRATVGGEGPALPVVLENPGNVLQRLSGQARVFTPEGQEVALLALEELPVWPGGVRRVLLEPLTPLPPGEYRVILLLEGPYGRYASEGRWRVP